MCDSIVEVARTGEEEITKHGGRAESVMSFTGEAALFRSRNPKTASCERGLKGDAARESVRKARSTGADRQHSGSAIENPDMGRSKTIGSHS
jgi:hypothetical protein